MSALSRFAGLRFSTAHILAGVAPKRELGDTDPERSASFTVKLQLREGFWTKSLWSPTFQSWLESQHDHQVNMIACYQGKGQHQCRWVLCNFCTNCCRPIQTWKSHTSSQPICVSSRTVIFFQLLLVTPLKRRMYNILGG